MSVLAARTIKRLYNKHLNKKTINKLLPTQLMNAGTTKPALYNHHQSSQINKQI